MEPVFTLPWNEFYIAEKLAKRFSKAKGFSVLVPTSRQEKDIDLVLLQRKKRKAITIQVKSSRTYIPAVPKRETTKRYKYYSWFNVFEVSTEADFYVLSSHYVDPPTIGTVIQNRNNWLKDCTMLFTNSEMSEFIKKMRTKGGKEEKMFGFGFNDLSKIVLTRGDEKRSEPNYTSHLFEQSVNRIAARFD